MSDFGSEFMSYFLKLMKRHNVKATTHEELQKKKTFYETVFMTLNQRMAMKNAG